MRHQIKTQRFSRNPNHRQMLFKQLVTSVIEHGRIRTTLKRAKAIRGLVDQMIGYARDGSLHAQRQARSVIKNPVAFKRLFTEIREDFLKLTHQGGYSRIYKLGYRHGDNAPMAMMELLNFVPKVKSEKGEKGSEKTTASQKVKGKVDSPVKAKAKAEKEKTVKTEKTKKKAEASETSKAKKAKKSD